MSGTLGIIAGTGQLPIRLIEACKHSGRNVFVLAFDHCMDNAVTGAAPHAVVRIGAVGEALAHLRGAGAKDLVLAGAFHRPSLSGLMPDATGTKLLARIGARFFAGDDALLKTVIAFLEEEGFRVVGAESIVRELLAPAGVLGKIQPDEAAKADIAFGFQEAKRLGERDIGQAVVVRAGHVIGAENADGTDALLARIGSGTGGVLVKAKKPQQEARVDLPTIGVHTVEAAHRAGLSGVAIEAGGGLIMDRDETVARADALGLFVVGAGDE